MPQIDITTFFLTLENYVALLILVCIASIVFYKTPLFANLKISFGKKPNARFYAYRTLAGIKIDSNTNTNAA
jgi:hypothetical protein